MPKLVHALNQPVVIANAAYFGDEGPRRLILVDIEPAGLWFSGEALHAPAAEPGLPPRPDDAVASMFFPFAQIGYLFDPQQVASMPEGIRTLDRMIDHPALASAPLGPPSAIDSTAKRRKSRR